ncbi:uncharacterized protein LOC125645738 [Ostrea edulis]|uniref:uncharacterized protein LOC125645738 n=1 Tax=Ostrea edulis TaxID=37623 RepID=UPI0024AF35DB|nr:uncharacterized protein LOC125645738 [Ostrea edulis]XP_048727496.2 uncharacterized protein LOC125645738 [Ostrea edulis]XP_055998234.1 uncharacterized protein LOC125645738 [Ostrea edulis]
MALPFLPHQDIGPAFQTLTGRASTEELRSLVGYMDRQWMKNPLFPPSAWSAYRVPVRTNNDVESWHHRINGKTGHRGCGFYVLCPLLLQEARLVESRVHSDNICRNVRKSSTTVQKKLDAAWEKYDVGDVSAGHFLRICGAVYAPVSKD